MLVAGETRSMTGSGYAVATASPAAEVTFTSGGCCRQCLFKTSIEPHKKQSTSNKPAGRIDPPRGFRILVARLTVRKHGRIFLLGHYFATGNNYVLFVARRTPKSRAN